MAFLGVGVSTSSEHSPPTLPYCCPADRLQPTNRRLHDGGDNTSPGNSQPGRFYSNYRSAEDPRTRSSRSINHYSRDSLSRPCSAVGRFDVPMERSKNHRAFSWLRMSLRCARLGPDKAWRQRNIPTKGSQESRHPMRSRLLQHVRSWLLFPGVLPGRVLPKRPRVQRFGRRNSYVASLDLREHLCVGYRSPDHMVSRSSLGWGSGSGSKAA
jgi:hypothetical protein